jgi:hypothetical protein
MNPRAGYFYASDENLPGLAKASLNVLEVTDAAKPIDFIQV